MATLMIGFWLKPFNLTQHYQLFVVIHLELFLVGTGVDRAVMEDLKKIQKEYTEVALPFIKNHSDLGFDAEVHTLDLYKHMVISCKQLQCIALMYRMLHII